MDIFIALSLPASYRGVFLRLDIGVFLQNCSFQDKTVTSFPTRKHVRMIVSDIVPATSVSPPWCCPARRNTAG